MVEDGKLVCKCSGHLVDTSKGSKGSKWIFVLSTSRKLYVDQKGTFQHSSFLAGGPTSAARRLVADEGILKETIVSVAIAAPIIGRINALENFQQNLYFALFCHNI